MSRLSVKSSGPRRALLVMVLVAVTLASGIAFAPRLTLAQTPATPSASATANGRFITVSGNGSAFASPDVAYVVLGVQLQNTDLSAAMKQADTNISAVIAALKKLGITDNQIQTLQYSVFLEQPNGPNNPAGSSTTNRYNVVNTLRITVNDTSKIGDILNNATAAGANIINNIDFAVKDRKGKETDARKAALDDAKAKATELATSIGATLGPVQNIQESGFGMPIPYANANMAVGGGGGGAGISGGQQAINVTLVVTYELR